MAARLTRAKRKIATARIPYAVPGAAELPERLDAVLTVIHLLYATGHAAPTGADLVRHELCDRALDLAVLVRHLLPDGAGRPDCSPYCSSTTPTTPPASDAAGKLLPPGGTGPRALGPGAGRRGRPPDRGRPPAGPPGRFSLQAAIAAVHAQAPSSQRGAGRRSWPSTTSCSWSGRPRWSR